jgi:hypothetical protein
LMRRIPCLWKGESGPAMFISMRFIRLQMLELAGSRYGVWIILNSYGQIRRTFISFSCVL